MNRVAAPPIPIDSLIFGYGPMLPFIAAALACWAMPAPWPSIAVWLMTIWGAMILTFVGGVRRGFGFGYRGACTGVEIATMLVYFITAGLALLLPWPALSVFLLAAGFALAAILDTRAALKGNAPAHFAALRIPQFGIATVSLLIAGLSLYSR
ncbi:DUF3429 family protein [Stakelama pacifica]|uniref:Uncharacterized protein DUF3429 n=1 Tax=Stakelama pacifica TaxID=517720 RepID=A0A4R6FUD3_9SPHN|nr:DUF3429 family protein [Stakelama pacifica]TDN85421.1 uncharacterized protein DUF3429 [Stakelama pacifica]GGO92695.1 hypothetical protein GCM10011329_10400 [Stakelama pacifica]